MSLVWACERMLLLMQKLLLSLAVTRTGVIKHSKKKPFPRIQDESELNPKTSNFFSPLCLLLRFVNFPFVAQRMEILIDTKISLWW